MEYWSVEKKDVNPLAINPTLLYPNTPKLIEIESSRFSRKYASQMQSGDENATPGPYRSSALYMRKVRSKLTQA
jgi:hypothetical protein